jgi:serine/threonine protein kinase
VSDRFIRCAHCGLPHADRVQVCPLTGLRIERPTAAHTRPRPRAAGEAAEQILGSVIDGKYRITSLIGQGGMSAIYEAQHVGLDRVVAIKVLHPSLADDPEAIARLNNEAQVVSSIGHPNICQVFDLGRTAAGSPYLVMERLVGESLAERIHTYGPLTMGALGPILLQILAALDAAHRKGIIHRDLKPENVFLIDRRGEGRTVAKLLDFGISKSMGYEFADERLTHTGMVMGTPYYMAPEQARGDSGLDQRVDLWAVGVIMYEALTGRRPFVATNYNALLVKILTSRPRAVEKVNPAVLPSVAAVVDKALSKLREDRYQNAAEFADAIKELLRQHAAEDEHAPTVFLRRKPRAHGLAPARAGERSRAGVRSWEIEDPDTFIDDDVPEPLEPTIQDRLSESELGLARADEDTPDTEVYTRGRAPGAEGITVREGKEPSQGGQKARRTATPRGSRARPARASRTGSSRSGSSGSGASRGKRAARGAAAKDRLSSTELMSEEELEGARHEERAAGAKKAPQPRAWPAPDDQDRTRFHDLEALEARRKSKRRAEGRSGSDGNGNGDGSST